MQRLSSTRCSEPRAGRCWLGVGVLALTGCAGLDTDRKADAVPVRGPLPLRTNGPLVQEFPAFRPRRAAVLPKATSEVRFLSAYSSIFENGTGTQGAVTLDGELWRTSALFRRGLGASTDVEVEVAAYYGTSGFLDVFVESWHAALGLPDSGREERDRFDYTMRVQSHGATVYELEGNDIGLGDVPVTLTHQLVEERAGVPGVSVQATVELPTGDESSGFGNGSIDWGVGLVLELTHDDWTFGGGASWIDRAPPSAFEDAGLDVIDPLQGWLSAEWRVARTLSLLGGLRYEAPVSKDLGIEELGGDVVELDLGLAHDLPGGSRVALGFSEDLVSASGPDFTAFLLFTARF